MIHNNEHILIIGGYGSAGSVIARQLSERFSGHIVVAGRSLKKANFRDPALSFLVTMKKAFLTKQ